MGASVPGGVRPRFAHPVYASRVRELLIALLVVLVVWAVALAALLLVGRKLAAKRLLMLVPHLVTSFRGLLADDRVPLTSKLLLGAGLVWIVSPIDLVPEFIPVLGPFDDVIVGALVLRHVVRRAGPSVVSDHWRGDDATLAMLLRLAGVRRRRRNDPRLTV